MASSLVVSLNKEKLNCRFLGLWNSRCARLRSLRRAQFLWQCLSANAEQCGCPEASIFLPILASSSASKMLVALPSCSLASSQVESNCSWSGVSGQVPNKAGQCSKAGSVTHISLRCSCTNNWSTRLIMPHPQGDLSGIAGQAWVAAPWLWHSSEQFAVWFSHE